MTASVPRRSRLVPRVLVALLVLGAAVGGWFLEGSRRDAVAVPTYAGDGRALYPVTPPWQPPNLVVLVVDTLRADVVDPDAGEGGPDPVAMPFVASLAREGCWFRQAAAPSSWTMPSLGSLLTGLLPARHGGLDSRQGPSLPRAVATFTEILAHAYGYDTAAFVDTPWIGGVQGFGQGFATYQEGFLLGHAADWVDGWLAARDTSRPYFLLLHNADVHDPYGPQNRRKPGGAAAPVPALAQADYDEPWELARAFFLDRPARDALRGQMGDDYLQHVIDYMSVGYAQDPRPSFADELRDHYYRGARIADEDIARLFAAMKARGALENTLFVITSDHGEAFGEHGILGHGRTLHDELVRVPLVTWGPGPFTGGKVVDEGVGLIDVLPTFFDLAGLRAPRDLDGRSFLGVAAGNAPGRPVISQEIRHMGNARVEGEIIVGSVRSPEWKYTIAFDRTSGIVRESVHDLLLDPMERTNLLDTDPASITFPPAFCEAVERCRDVTWETDARNRPKPCEFVR